MKKFFIAAATIFAAFLVYAPVWDNYFTTNKNPTVPWTNDGSFVYLSKTGTNNTTGLAPRIPPFVFRTDGSLFMGTNVGQDVNELDLTKFFPLYQISFTDSNQQPDIVLSLGGANNESGGFSAQTLGNMHIDPNNPHSMFSLVSQSTNQGRALLYNAQPGNTYMILQSGGITAYQVNDDGNLSLIRTQAYVWPVTHGTNGSALIDTNGLGGLAWTAFAVTNLAGGFLGGTNTVLSTNASGTIVINSTGGSTNGFASTNYVNTATNSLGAVPTNRAVNTTAPLNGGGTLNVDRTLGIAFGPLTNTFFATNGGTVTIGALPQTPWLQNEWMHGFSGTNGADIQLTNTVMLTRPDGSGTWLTNQGISPQVRLFQTGSATTNATVTLSNSDLRIESVRAFVTNNLTIQQLGTNSATDLFDANTGVGTTVVSISSTGTVVMAGSTNLNAASTRPATLSIYGGGSGNQANPGLVELYGTNNQRLLTFSEFPNGPTANDYPYIWNWGGGGGAGNESFKVDNFVDRAPVSFARYGYVSYQLDSTAIYFLLAINGDNAKIPAMTFGNANSFIDGAHLQAPQGTASYPSWTFQSKTNDGMYLVGGGTYGLTVSRNSRPVATFYDDVSTATIPGFYLTNGYGLFWTTNLPSSGAPIGGHISGIGFYPLDIYSIMATNNLYVASNAVVQNTLSVTNAVLTYRSNSLPAQVISFTGTNPKFWTNGQGASGFLMLSGNWTNILINGDAASQITNGPTTTTCTMTIPLQTNEWVIVTNLALKGVFKPL